LPGGEVEGQALQQFFAVFGALLPALLELDDATAGFPVSGGHHGVNRANPKAPGRFQHVDDGVAEWSVARKSAAGETVGVQTKIPTVANGLEAGLGSVVEFGQEERGERGVWCGERRIGAGRRLLLEETVEEVAAEQFGVEFGVGFRPGKDIEPSDFGVHNDQQAALTRLAGKTLERLVQAIRVGLESIGHGAGRGAGLGLAVQGGDPGPDFLLV